MPLVALILVARCVAASVRAGRVPLMDAAPALLASAFAMADLAPALEWGLLTVVFVGGIALAFLAKRAVSRADRRGDLQALERHCRRALLLIGDPAWAAYRLLARGRTLAHTDLAAARPVLAEAAAVGSVFQPSIEVELAGLDGDEDITRLVDERWEGATESVRGYLLNLAVIALVRRGRVVEALARLARADPALLTRMRYRALASIAAGVADHEALEAILAREVGGLPDDHPDIYRAIADWAGGRPEDADRRLGLIDVPPGGRLARIIADLRAHPTPAFADSTLDATARGGLERYRELVRSRLEAGGAASATGRSRQLRTALPGVAVTSLVAVNAAAFVASTHDPTVIWRFSNPGTALAAGEWYRLVTSAFLHLNAAHLALNMVVLLIVGSALERILGSGRFVAVYLLAAIGGSLASAVWTASASVGASGAVLGVMGALWVTRRLGRTETDGVGSAIVVAVVLGAAVPRLDTAAHVGGLLVGLAVGAGLEVARTRSRRMGTEPPA